MAKKEEKQAIAEQIASYDALNSKLKFIKTDIEILDAFLAGEKDVNKPNIGVPTGKIIGISGKNGIGKSTLLMEISKRICMKDWKVVYLDVEKGLNVKSIRDYGLMDFAAYDPTVESNISDSKMKEIRLKCLNDFLSGEKTFYPTSPRSYNQCLETIRYIFDNSKKQEIKLLVIDSIKDIMSTKVMDEEGETEEFQMMQDAKAQEYFLLKLKNLLAFKDCICIILNQVRTKFKGQFAVEDEAGGNAWLHRCDIRLFMKEKEKILQDVINSVGEKDNKKIGNWVDIEIRKGRFGNAFSTLSLPLIFGKGYSNVYLYHRKLQEVGIIKKIGQSYEFILPLLEINQTYKGEGKGYKIIKENFDQIREYILKNNLLFVEKEDE
jgi:RecA/RadA recombinase